MLDICIKSQSQSYGGGGGGALIWEKEEEDARLLDCCEAKRKEWSIHWQCDEEVQNTKDKTLEE